MLAALRALLWLVVAGCNPVFGLDKTDLMTPIDAQYFDAPADAPYACPPNGGEPRFNRFYNQLPALDIVDYYMPAPDIGIAIGRLRTGEIGQGPLDMALTPATLTPNGLHLKTPRISPDGDVLFVENEQTLKVDVYRRAGEGWAASGITIDDASYRVVTNATRGPTRRVVQTDFDGANYMFRELVEDGSGAWNEVDLYPIFPALGVGFVQSPQLSGDGLRLTFVGPVDQNNSVIFTSTRPDIASRFGTAVRLSTVPQIFVDSPYMTDDCGRFYFGAIRTVFFQTQE